MRIRTKKMPNKILDVGPQELAALEHWGLVLEHVDERSHGFEEGDTEVEDGLEVVPSETWKTFFNTSSD